MTPLCRVWHSCVKEFFQRLHGHQRKVLALFVLGAIRAGSIVTTRVAEALLEESDAKAPSIERRLERFLSNERVEVKETWGDFLQYVLPYFRKGPMQLVLDITTYKEQAQVIYLGLLQHSRVLPLAWKVMPGQQKWEQGLWDCVDELFKRIAPHLEEAECTMQCTLAADTAFGCLPMVKLCEKYKWHYVFRIPGEHTCRRWDEQGRLLPACAVSSLVDQPGKRFYGRVRLWQEEPIDTFLSAFWDKKEEKALLVISDLPARGKRIKEYKKRWRVEPTFQDLKRRGWDWEASHVQRLDRVDRLLLVLFLLIWWLAHLAASCIHHGQRDRYDRHDRRDKGIFRLGRLYLLDIERKASHPGDLKRCLLFQRSPTGWSFSLRF